MKLGILLAFILGCSVTLPAQTNVIPFLHTMQGDFENATIIRTNPAYLVVSHAGGITKVAMTNLSPEMKTRFGYDPAKADAALEAEQKKIEAARLAKIAQQQYLASLAGPVQTIRCTAVLDAFGLCQIVASNGTQQAYMVGLPASVRKPLVRLSEIKAEIYRLEHSKIYVTGYANNTFDDAFYSQMAADRAMDAANESKRLNLNTLKTEQDEIKETLVEATTFRAYNTGLSDNGIPRWQAVQ